MLFVGPVNASELFPDRLKVVSFSCKAYFIYKKPATGITTLFFSKSVGIRPGYIYLYLYISISIYIYIYFIRVFTAVMSLCKYFDTMQIM